MLHSYSKNSNEWIEVEEEKEIETDTFIGTWNAFKEINRVYFTFVTTMLFNSPDNTFFGHLLVYDKLIRFGSLHRVGVLGKDIKFSKKNYLQLLK